MRCPFLLPLVFVLAVLFAGAALAAEKGASEPLTQFKTADALWRHIETLKRGPGQDFTSAEEAKDYIGRVKLAAMEFSRRYANDPRRWEARMIVAQTAAVLQRMNGGKASGEQQEALYKEVLAAPDAPAPVKTEAQFGLLQIHLVPALESRSLTPELESEMSAFEKDFPGDDRASAVAMMHLRLLGKSDPAKAKAMLQELAKSKNQAVAVEARDRLRQSELLGQSLDLKFTALDGRAVDLGKLRGQVVLVDFWATWCAPCMAELPGLVEVYKKYHVSGFEIIGISLDEEKAKLLAVMQNRGVTWPQHFDGKGPANAIAAQYGIHVIPRAWIVNKKGVVVDVDATEGLGEKIEKLLAE